MVAIGLNLFSFTEEEGVVGFPAFWRLGAGFSAGAAAD